jgi:hypothetical protein
VRREPCALDFKPDHGRPRDRDRPAPPCKSAEAPARLCRAQAIDPDTEGNDMTHAHLRRCLPAKSPAAPTCALDETEQDPERTQWNDTPDAIADWRAYGPQSQHWRGFPLTTASREADHSQTTPIATH